jgi:hypothetical protein
MINPIEKALNRLHEYSITHPEHDTDEILKDARTYLKEFKKKNSNEAIELQELAAGSAGYDAAKDSIKELSQEESYVLWTSLNSEFKELRSGWDDFQDFDLFARAYIRHCLQNKNETT